MKHRIAIYMRLSQDDGDDDRDDDDRDDDDRDDDDRNDDDRYDNDAGYNRNSYDGGSGMAMPGRIMDTGMYSMGNMSGDSQEGCWVKYVAQAGDTLQDILDRSECTTEMFWEKNQADKMYMLPGVAYFILENCTD